MSSTFTINNWPPDNEAARNALETMQNTHRPLPLPAYDAYGELISPECYQQNLQGATVKVHFTMTHSITGQNTQRSDTYTADIQSICVLIPPNRIQTLSTKKRNLFRTDPHTQNLNPRGKQKECE
jgi:hypothetical protein